ncbi:MAG: hypothetical protein NTX16_03650 [Actinobacteria bacterium]|nr:hypothetical protein [Actinomycetota bacterium]
MASDISCGPTSSTDTRGAPHGVAASRTRARFRSRLAGALCLLLAAALGVAGASACGGSSTASISPAAIASGTPVALSTSAAAKEPRGMLPVVFTQSLIKEHKGGSSKTVGDVEQMRHYVWTLRQDSSDPRLSGRFDVVFNVDQRQADMSARFWGTSRLSNQGGTWVGKWTGGIAAAGQEHHCYLTQKGTGDYAGLVAHCSGWFVEAGDGFTADIQIVNAGWIETTDGSPVPPAPGPGSTPANWTPVVAIDTINDPAYEGPEPWIVDVHGSDARVGGRLEGWFEEAGAERSDRSVDYGGSWSITNVDGAWKSTLFSGVRGPDAVEHFQYATFSGSGAYAGLTYHEFSHFMERQDYVKGDALISTGWIEEAMQ